LTSAQISELLALPTDEPTLIRHYTSSDTDLAVIQRRRRPHNRLGFALQLCTLRYPGRLPLNEVAINPIAVLLCNTAVTARPARKA
jgi:hypothetical protein